MTAGVKVTNYKEIQRSLKRIGIPQKEINQAGKDAAESVIREARTLAPVRTGKLRNSIAIGPTKYGAITVKAGNNRRGPGGVPYANPIHWGWGRRKIKPQPFFRKALKYTYGEIMDNYAKSISNLIKQEYAKQAITRSK